MIGDDLPPAQTRQGNGGEAADPFRAPVDVGLHAGAACDSVRTTRASKANGPPDAETICSSAARVSATSSSAFILVPMIARMWRKWLPARTGPADSFCTSATTDYHLTSYSWLLITR